MDLFEAEIPKEEKIYDITRGIYRIPARNTLLWVLYCLYQPTRIPAKQHIADLSLRARFSSKEKKLLKLVKKKGVSRLRTFDVILLSKIIKETCGLNRTSATEHQKETLKKIQKTINGVLNVRHKFAHDDSSLNEYEKDDFEKMIFKLIDSVEFLVIEAGKLSNKTPEKSEKKLSDIKINIQQRWNAISIPLQNEDLSEVHDLDPAEHCEEVLHVVQEKIQEMDIEGSDNDIIETQIDVSQEKEQDTDTEDSDEEIIDNLIDSFQEKEQEMDTEGNDEEITEIPVGISQEKKQDPDEGSKTDGYFNLMGAVSK